MDINKYNDDYDDFEQDASTSEALLEDILEKLHEIKESLDDPCEVTKKDINENIKALMSFIFYGGIILIALVIFIIYKLYDLNIFR